MIQIKKSKNENRQSLKDWGVNSKKTSINLIGLYGKFRNDISIETNTLTNLNNKIIIDTIKNNITRTLYKSKNRRFNRIGRLSYQKIIYDSSNHIRQPQDWEGIYLISVPSKNIRKYYTSFLYLSKFLISEKIHPKEIEVART